MQILPIDVGAYFGMHMEVEAYKTYDKLKRFVFTYVNAFLEFETQWGQANAHR